MTVRLLNQHRCRICLGNDNFQLDIFREDDNQKQILLKIKTCLPIKVVKGDGNPSTICYKCLVQLDNAFELWRKSFDTEEILKYNPLNGRIKHYISNYKQENSILEEFQIDQPACDSGIFPLADSEESFLDSLEENVWKSPHCHSSWSTLPIKRIPRKGPHEKYDLVSDPDSSEVDEVLQRKHCFYTKQNPADGKILEEKEFFEVNSRIKNRLGHVSVSEMKKWQNLAADDELTVDVRSNSKSRYMNKNLFGGQLKYEDDSVTESNDHSTNHSLDDELTVDVRSNSKKGYMNKKLFGGQLKYEDDSVTESNENSNDRSTKNGLDKELVRRISFPWSQYNLGHHSKRIKPNEIPKQEDRIENTPVSVNSMNGPSTQGDSRNLDFNQCPKCCKILTPSQNLLSHIQSHKD